MKKKVDPSANAHSSELPIQKERHIVSWSQEEDDILREQIRINGTENWAIVASKFKDKTTRQCRRRWFTYLNTDFKKGGWTPEEDMLLCEAQKIFGNRWTEIAKVVSGRTDNAVKNRFTTLCKKRAKHEALAKENNATYINLNNKRVVFPNGLNTEGGSEIHVSYKKLRTSLLDNKENYDQEKPFGGAEDHQLRPPFTVISEEEQSCKVDNSNHLAGNNVKELSVDGSISEKMQGTFLKKDNPKLIALMQQAELLSSLAVKVNSEMTEQNLESAWMVLQDFLNKNKESNLLASGNSEALQVDKIKEFLEDLRSYNEGIAPVSREPDLFQSSPASSESDSVLALLCNTPCVKMDSLPELSSDELDNGTSNIETTNEAKNILTSNATKSNNRILCEYSNAQFSSPRHVTPLFGSFTAAIPSPVFSESEKRFLRKTLGMESTSPKAIANPSKAPPCKRSLLQCL